jgi:hypothetical protein
MIVLARVGRRSIKASRCLRFSSSRITGPFVVASLPVAPQLLIVLVLLTAQGAEAGAAGPVRPGGAVGDQAAFGVVKSELDSWDHCRRRAATQRRGSVAGSSGSGTVLAVNPADPDSQFF